jgi:hypothetical protein
MPVPALITWISPFLITATFTHTVFVFQVAFQRDRDNFHIIVRVFAKAASA